MKKRLFLFVLAFVFLTFGLTSCSSSNNESSTSTGDTQVIKNNTDLVINDFVKNGDSYVGKINNDKEIFSFLNVVKVDKNSTWKLFSDVSGKNEITTKTVNLELGDNIYYILVSASSNEMKLYTVNAYRLHMYNVLFDTDGGNHITSQKVQEDSLVKNVDNPEKAGYSFVGWDYDFSKPVKSDLTIRAKWSAHKCTITFDVNGGDKELSGIEVYYGDRVTLPTPNKKGYTFSGWYLNNVLVNSGNWSYEGTITLKAKWTINTYKIVYESNGGSLSDGNIQYVTYGDNFNLKATSKTGYVFEGWYKNNELFHEGKWDYLEDVYLSAKWTAEIYSVKLNLNGGNIESNDEFEIAYDSNLTLPTPSKTGYKFDGWFDSDTIIQDKIWKFTTNKTFEARWTAETYSVNVHDVSKDLYNVRYDYNDGRGTFKNIQLGVGDFVEYPIPVSEDNNTFFCGWYLDPDCQNIYQFQNEITGSIQLYAKWKTIDIVSFTPFKGDVVLNRSAYISDMLVFVAPYTGQLDLKISGVTSGFYIGYRLYKYVDGSGTSIGTIEINKSGTASTNYAVKTLNATQGDIYYLKVYSATNIATTFSMKINFELINKTKITAQVKSKLSNLSSKDITYDSYFNLQDINYPGYEFKGWYSEDNGGGVKIEADSAWKHTDVFDVYPYLIPQNYTITFNTNGGTLSQNTKTVNYNDSYSLPLPSKQGYSFEGWYYNNSLISDGIWMYTVDVTLDARWSPKSYKCTFSEYSSGIEVYLSLNMNDGYTGVYDRIKVNQDESIDYPVPPMRVNYCFTGWYTDQACTKLFDLTKDLDANTEIYAGWRTYQTEGENKKEELILNGEKKTYSFTNLLYFLTFVALDTGTYRFNYENASSDAGYFLHDYDDSTVGSNHVTKISGNGSFTINVVKGHMYYVGLSGAEKGSTATAWLTGNLPTINIKQSSSPTLTMEYLYGQKYNLGLPNIPSDKTFVGWYTGMDGTGTKLTDSNGNSITEWNYTTSITVYPYFL